MSGDDSATITLLRFPLAVLVVSLHCYIELDGWDVASLALQGAGSNLAGLLMVTLSEVVAHVAVPTFFVVSGYLFFLNLDRWDSQQWRHKMERRIHTLLIPYLLWNTLRLVQMLGIKVAAIVAKGKPWSHIADWIDEIGGLAGIYWGGGAQHPQPILIPMWFVRNLMVVLLLTPLLYWLLRPCSSAERPASATAPSQPTLVVAPRSASDADHRRQSLSPVAHATLVVLTGLSLGQAKTGLAGLSVSSVLFFSIGATRSLHGLPLTAMSATGRRLAALLTLATGCVLVGLAGEHTEAGRVIMPFFALTGTATTLHLASWLVRQSRRHPRLGALCCWISRQQGATFFIFAAHAILLTHINTITALAVERAYGIDNYATMAFADQHPLTVPTLYVGIIVMTVGLCLGLSRLMQRHLPRVHRVLCGR